MTLEDFEKSLAQAKEDRGHHKHSQHHHDGERRRHHHHHHRHSHREDEDHHKRKRKRQEDDEHGYKKHRHRRSDAHGDESASEVGEEDSQPTTGEAAQDTGLKRDSWMERPSGHDIDYVQKVTRKPPEKPLANPSRKEFELKVHEKELNKNHLQNLGDDENSSDELPDTSIHEVKYVFGDAGSRWRMTKLKGVYRKAEEEKMSVDDVAIQQFGDLQSFDEAREEEIELDRRVRYGADYVGKEKPSGELFKERRLNAQAHNDAQDSDGGTKRLPAKEVETKTAHTVTLPLDQTALNRLKAQMIKAKMRGGPEAERLEAEYNNAIAGFANTKQPDVIVLGTMENRMLTGGRKGEVKSIDNKRGRERGLVEENEDMSIEDMVREERRTRGQAGGDGLRLAERIAKDGKFDNDLDYMDENAAKLAKRVHRSEINLKSTAISDFKKMSRVLDNCPLCHHEDTDKPPLAPIVSLATRTYLTLPTEPEVSDGGGACIIPIQHRTNLLECDDDEWEEIRNFMKSLTRMYHDQGRSVIFYENASAPHKHRHAGMEVVPLPYSLGDLAPQFFKEAILAADEEWSQHKKIIDTLARAKKDGLGKLAFRRTLVKEMPYFHVWFEMDGGLGHVIEDENRWPKGDLFAREIVGGMLDKGPEVVKKQGRWRRDDVERVEGFRKRWRKFDWTRVLMDA